MSLKAKDIDRAVSVAATDPTNKWDADDLLEALERIRPVLIVLWSGLPWWRKVIVGLGALLKAIDSYLGKD